MCCCQFTTSVLLALTAFFPPEATVTAVTKPPAGLSDKVAAAVTPTGQQVMIHDVAVCSVWLAKDLPVKAGFKPSLNVKYPFTPGQFIGVMEVQKKSEFTDFRGQEVPAGVYTLRYGQQPVDGNHVGTSETHDFLLAVPAKTDVDPAVIANQEEFFKKSAATVGANHPAIFSLLPAETTTKAAVLEHDTEKELWLLTVLGQPGGKPLPIKLVVVGKSEG